MAVKSEPTKPAPEAELRSFIEVFPAKDQKLFRAVRAAARKRFPTANELAYAYPDSVVISYTPTEAAIEAVAAIALRADDVRLYLMNGPQLPDPKGLLQGSGKQTRYVSLEAASRMAHADVEALIAAAVAQAKVPLPADGTPRLIIKTAAAKQKAARKPKK